METPPRLQPQSMGDLFDAAVRLYRAHFATFFGIVAVLLVPATILKLLALNSPGATSALELLQSTLLNNFGTGVLAITIGRLYLGQPVTIGAAYRQGARAIWRLLVASFALGLLAVGAMLPMLACIFALAFNTRNTGVLTVVAVALMIVPVAFLLTRYVFVTQAVVLEESGPVDALKRSWQLTRGSFWRIAAVVVAVSLLSALLTRIPVMLLSWTVVFFGLSDLLVAAQLGGMVISQVGLMLAMPIQLAIYTLLYYDMRVRHEGYDLELLGSQVAAQPLAEQPL
jgi:hypothetical protein